MDSKELMQPRFELLLDYPDCEFEPKDIIVRIEGATNDYYHKDPQAIIGGIHLSVLEKFPHIFRKLNWWEHRKEKDMPKKVESHADEKRDVYEIQKWDMENLVGFIDIEKREVCSLLSFKPEFGYFPVD